LCALQKRDTLDSGHADEGDCHEHRTEAALARPPLSDGRPETWVYLADCPMPEAGRHALEAELKEHPFRGKELVDVEENSKLTYLFVAGATSLEYRCVDVRALGVKLLAAYADSR
jgi:hypothetical protein